jgi:hypothetical protein
VDLPATAKKSRSVAIANGRREPARIAGALHPKVETTTVRATKVAPHPPTSAVAARSAMRVTPCISSIRREYRYAMFTVT